MGRAIIFILSSLILTLTFINKTEGWTSDPPNQWDSFTSQYRLLVSDGKDELAERMWKNTYPEMEKYAQSLPPDKYALWSTLSEDLKDKDRGLRFNVEPIFLFLEVTSSDNPDKIIEKWLNPMVRQVEEEQSTSSDIINNWALVRPVINSYTIKEDVILVDEALNDWSYTDDDDTARAAVANSLNNLMKTPKSEESEALLWMAVIIGGSITMTLSYVGMRMYRGRSKNRHKLKSGSS